MGDDREFRIKITNTCDTTGVEQEKNALDDLGPKQRKYTENIREQREEVDKSEISHRALRLGLHELGSGAAEAGHLLLTGMANPATAAFIAMTGSMGLLLEHLAKIREAVKEAANGAVDQFKAATERADELANKASEVNAKLQEEFDSLARGQESIESRTQKILQGYDDEEKAIVRVMKARETYDLSQAGTEEQRVAIRLRYSEGGQQFRDEMQARRIAAQQTELDEALRKDPELKRARDEAERATTGSAGGQISTDIANYKKDLGILDLMLRKAEEEVIKSPQDQRAIAERDRLKSSYAGTNQTIQELENFQKRAKSEFDLADQLYKQNHRIIVELQPELPRLRREAAVEQGVGALEGLYGRAAAMPGGFERAAKQLQEAAGLGDPVGIALATQQLARWPALMRELQAAIFSATGALEASLQQLRSQIRDAHNP
jgi:hypothetical protein